MAMLSADFETLDRLDEPADAAFLRSAEGLDGPAVLRAAIAAFPGQVAVVSSFGAESAVLLSLVAEVDRDGPVLFLDTGKHFDETLDYRHALAARLGLRDVRDIRPTADDLARADADGDLWVYDADACCHVRKVSPLARALAPFTAWVSGRKRHQAATRASIRVASARAGGCGSTRWPTGPRRAWPPRSRRVGCRRIRWWPAAIRRSAAPPARSRWRRGPIRAVGAGPG